MDKELDCRDYRFCRNVDDVRVYVKSRRADEHVMDCLSETLENSLRLTVNLSESAVDRLWKRGYLDYSLTRHKPSKLTLVKTSQKCMIKRVLQVLKRGRGRRIQRVITAVHTNLDDVKRPLKRWINGYAAGCAA